MKNYKKVNVNTPERTELHDQLDLTGAEISVNELPAGAQIPFVHAHKDNEEVYIILDGNGYMLIDGEKVDLSANDFLRVSPAAKRQMSAAEDEGIKFVCIQTKENSLGGYTVADAIMVE